MNSCVPEGAVQCLVDGELHAAELREVVSHLSSCDSCAKAERAARSEADLVASLFAPDDRIAVPTRRLWAGVVTALGGARPARALGLQHPEADLTAAKLTGKL
jgi:anti-sigma factor RsiW